MACENKPNEQHSRLNTIQEARIPLLCKYKTGRCQQFRSTKSNAEFHRYCDYHREKANENQRRLEQKKRSHKNGLKRSYSFSVHRPDDIKEFNAQEITTSKRGSKTPKYDPLPFNYENDEKIIFPTNSYKTPKGDSKNIQMNTTIQQHPFMEKKMTHPTFSSSCTDPTENLFMFDHFSQSDMDLLWDCLANLDVKGKVKEKKHRNKINDFSRQLNFKQEDEILFTLSEEEQGI